MVIYAWLEHFASTVVIFIGKLKMEPVYSLTLSPNDNLYTKPV